MESFIVVNRNLLKSCIAEFNRRSFNQVTGFQTEREFVKEANKTTTRAIPYLAEIFSSQTSRKFYLFTSVFATGKPVLVLSHEDMTRDLLTQLLRVVHFLGRDSDPQYAERALCTFYSEGKIAKATKRTYKLDFTAAALSILNRSQVIESIQETEKVLRQSKRSYSDVDAMIDEIFHHLANEKEARQKFFWIFKLSQEKVWNWLRLYMLIRQPIYDKLWTFTLKLNFVRNSQVLHQKVIYILFLNFWLQ